MFIGFDPSPSHNEQSPGTCMMEPRPPATVEQVSKTPDLREGSVAAVHVEGHTKDVWNADVTTNGILAVDSIVMGFDNESPTSEDEG